MNLIFEGLRRNSHRQKQSLRITSQTELSEKASDLPMATASSHVPNLLQILTEPDPSCVTVDSTPKQLPIVRWRVANSFPRRQRLSLKNCAAIWIGRFREKVKQGLAAIGNIFSSLLNYYRAVFDKILSVYLPNRWIQSVTVFLLKSSAMALSCCFVIVIVKNALRSSMPQNAQNATSHIVASKTNAIPRNKLKPLSKDPLIMKQEKIKNTLLAIHMDNIQRPEKDDGQIIIDNTTYSLGSLMSEHPRIWLEKIGKNSLYFSDKYGQYYKRSIGNMLE